MTKRNGISVLPGILLAMLLVLAGTAAWFWITRSQETSASQPFNRARTARKPADKSTTIKPSPKPAPFEKPVRKSATAAQRQSAMRSVLGQLDAFKRDDYKAAIAFQSRDLQRNFPSPEVFRNMIRQSYPQFAHYKTVTFGPATNQTQNKKTLLELPITLVGQDDVSVRATYFMSLEDGVYLVSGVAGGLSTRPSKSPKTFPVPPAYRGIAPLIT